MPITRAASLIIFPIIPAAAIWYIFGPHGFGDILVQSTGINDTQLQASGGIGSYLIITFVFFRTYKWLAVNDTRPESRRKRELDSIADRLVASDWKFDAQFKINAETGEAVREGEVGVEMTAAGTAVISRGGDGKLYLQGQWEDGADLGIWKAQEIILTGRSLTYLFEIPADGVRVITPVDGITKLQFDSRQQKGHIKAMHGTWGIVGSLMKGRIDFTRS